MNQTAAEIAESIATSVMSQLDEFAVDHRGIPVGETDLQIVEVDYDSDEPDDNFSIQLSDGRTFECLVYEVAERPGS